jgi:hypothetical protein
MRVRDGPVGYRGSAGAAAVANREKTRGGRHQMWQWQRVNALGDEVDVVLPGVAERGGGRAAAEFLAEISQIETGSCRHALVGEEG